jgi:predicted aspartyl protease
MGHVCVEATIKAKRKLKARFLVDTGATCSLISPDFAKRLGMEPSRLREKIHLANGKTVPVRTALGTAGKPSRSFGLGHVMSPCWAWKRSRHWA